MPTYTQIDARTFEITLPATEQISVDAIQQKIDSLKQAITDLSDPVIVAQKTTEIQAVIDKHQSLLDEAVKAIPTLDVSAVSVVSVDPAIKL